MIKSFAYVISASLMSVQSYAQTPVPSNLPLPPVRPANLIPSLAETNPREAFYKELGVSSFFVNNGQLTPETTAVRNLLLSASEQGLSRKDYWTDRHEAIYSSFNASQAEEFETLMYETVIKFGRDLSTGRFEPGAAGEDVRFDRKKFDVTRVAQALKTTSPDLRSNFDKLLAPQWPLYKTLKNLHADLTAANGQEIFPVLTPPQWKVLPKLKQKDASLVNVKVRLRTLGYAISEISDEYTAELRDVVKQYALDHALKGTSDLLNKRVWSHLGVSLAARISQIRMNMEKLRWLPNATPERFIFVNTAIQRLRLMENGEIKMQMRTINGRPARKTPTMQDRIPVVELNPDWTAPAKLILEDKLPYIITDPGYLYRNNFQVIDAKTGQAVDESLVNWSIVDKSNVGQILIRQKPGLGNALGIMKFHLTNPYAIYLHDTNERHLFKKSARLLSSGCVRVEKPVDLALELLRDFEPWNEREVLEGNLSDVAVEEYDTQFTEKMIRLKKPVPTYLMYVTVDVNDRGAIIFANDFYELDARIYRVLSGMKN